MPTVRKTTATEQPQPQGDAAAEAGAEPAAEPAPAPSILEQGPEAAEVAPKPDPGAAPATADTAADQPDPEAAGEQDEPPVQGGVPVTFHGYATTSVAEVGLWAPEETKNLPAGLAKRLCRKGQEMFTRAVE